MATFSNLFGLQEQICYVQCGYCSTILLVSVPCSSLSMVVNVRCGHCTSLLSVNMLKASVVPLHLFASLNHQDEEPKQEVFPGKDNADDQQKAQINSICSKSDLYMSSDEEEEDVHPVNQVINKPPEKRQRAPSAYNRFIKEEIRRLKDTYPNMTHKQAFSTAAKNWAHFPLSQQKGDEEQGNQGGCKMPSYSDIEKGHVEGNGFREGKNSSHAVKSKAPFE